MAIDIIVPAAGESVTEADIVDWRKSSGEYVEMDEILLELETDKASLEMTAEAAGVLTILIEEGTVSVGDKIGSIDTEASAPASSEPAVSETPAESPKEEDPVPAPKAATQESAPAASSTASYATGHPSPSAAKLMAEKGVDAAQVTGTRKDGRITKTDVAAVDASTTSNEEAAQASTAQEAN